MCHAAACRYLSWAPAAKVPGHPPAFVSTQLSNLWDLSLLPRSFLQPQSSSSTSYFPRSLLPFRNPSSVYHFFPGRYTLRFPNLDSLGKEAQRMTVLLIGGSLSSLFLNWKIQDRTLLFSTGVIKIYSQSIAAAASKQEASA